MNILALDVATKTGWASNVASGVWDLKTKRDESSGMKLIRLRSKLKEIHDVDPIDVVVMERPAGKFKASIIHQSQLHGAIITFCEDNGIDYRMYSAGEIKKHATGKGNAGKPAMIAAAKEQWPLVEVIDDNHADAMWLWDLASNDLL